MCSWVEIFIFARNFTALTLGIHSCFFSKNATRIAALRQFTAWKNPCNGEPERDSKHRPKACLPFDPTSCSVGYFCLAGDPLRADSNFCCPVVGAETCQAKKESGTGQLQLQRWYYNPSRKDCEQFVYHGLKGNENNFLDRNTCENLCVPDVNPCQSGEQPYKRNNRNFLCRKEYRNCPTNYYCHVGWDEFSTVCCPSKGDPCNQPKLPGDGTNMLQRYYFDKDADTCNRFTYRGQQGNENNFRTSIECERACPGYKGYCPHGKPLLQGSVPHTCSVDTACPPGYLCHISDITSQSICCEDPATFCLLPRQPGPCTSAGAKQTADMSGTDDELRYGYNSDTNTCVAFRYGGCGGNLNNFKSIQKCVEICCDKGFK